MTPATARLTVVGAGLAGCEAAWQAASLGARVRLIDIKPEARTPAHHLAEFAELVCSNSLGSQSAGNAKGLLKMELSALDSLIIRCAEACKVPAGGALAVDRVSFSQTVTAALQACDKIGFECGEVTRIPDERPCIIATGPLTTPSLLRDIADRFGSEGLYFFDAASPIVTRESLDESRTYRSSRYDKGEGAYINCPMTRDQYDAFVTELLNAETAAQHGFEDSKLFEGCVPVESLAGRGRDTLRFGPMKPKGLRDPRTGLEPYAAVQLRQDDLEGRLYSLVGFQTRLKHGEQKRVFSMIPGLERAEFVRYGVMHKNAYINSPGILSGTYEARGGEGLYFTGQITGVEGYVESVSSGLVAGVCSVLKAGYGITPRFPPETLIGALAGYVSNAAGANRNACEPPNTGECEPLETGRRTAAGVFQPMNANFGILPLPDAPDRRVPKKERNERCAERSLAAIAGTAELIRKYRV